MVYPRSRSLALLFALCLAAVGCGGSDDAADSSAGGVVATEEGVTEESALDETADEETATEETDAGETDPGEADTDEADPEMADEDVADEEATETEGDDTGDGACLVGDWVVAESELDGYYAQVETGLGEGVTFDITGDTGLAFADDGTYLYTPNFTFEVDVEGIVAEGSVTGTLGGTYEVVDSVVETTVVDDSLEITVSAAGITMSASDLGMDLATFAPVSSAPVDCSGENPVVGYDLGNGSRQPVELTPA